MPISIPLCQPDVTQREIDAVVDVLHSATLSMGRKIEEFEAACAKVAGRRHGIGVASATAGLHCAMLAAGIDGGDEVITTPFSFVASVNCILYVGATPVFVDIDPKTLNLDVEKVESAITPKTRAIVAVETFGHPGGMIELERIARRHELVLIEDAREGFGGQIGQRPIGSFGRAGVFGFFSNSQITTGEGGMIVTDDDALADLCRSLRNQGRDEPALWLAHQRLGYNYRLSELAAALGLTQVRRLEEILQRRRAVAQRYIERLMTNRYLILPTLDDDTQMSWYAFVVRLNDLFEPADRDMILAELRGEGIECADYFPPIHLQPYVAAKFGFKKGEFPVCEYVSARTIALPFFTNLTIRQVDRVCDVLENSLNRTMMSRGGRF